MNRRRFISTFAGAVASVSIGLKLSQGMPVAATNPNPITHDMDRTTAIPTYSFSNDLNTGIYRAPDDRLKFVIRGRVL